MKKILLCSAFLFFVFNSFSQEKTKTVSREAYLLKSKKQHKTGLVLLAGGVVCIAAGLIIPEGDPTGEINWVSATEVHENDGIRAAFGYTGIISALGSIPFFIASNKNKKRAMKTVVSFNNKTLQYLNQNNFVLSSQPTFTVNIAL